MNKKVWIVAFVLLVSFISFSRSFLGLIGVVPWHYGYSDIFNADRINPVTALKLPYLEVPIEYPLVTGFFIYLMWFLGKGLLGYAILSYILLTLFAIITALTLYKLCEILNVIKNRLWPFFVFAPSMIIFNIFNWDIIAVMFMVLAIYLYYRNKFILASLFLAIGFNAKLFPILMLPIMLLKTNWKNRIKMALTFVIMFIVLNIYFMIKNFSVWKSTYLFHSLRQPNIDSVWALTGLSTQIINILSLALFLLFFALLSYNHKKYDAIKMGFLVVLLFLIVNKIFSPQYILWLLPFFVLSSYMTKMPFYLVEASNLIIFITTSTWMLASKKFMLLLISHLFTLLRSVILLYLLYIILKSSASSIGTSTKNI